MNPPSKYEFILQLYKCITVLLVFIMQLNEMELSISSSFLQTP